MAANPHTKEHDYKFLIDIAELLISARRAISYCFPIRYYMKGPNHQDFFDGQRGNLERYLELLNKKNEVNWFEEVLETNLLDST